MRGRVKRDRISPQKTPNEWPPQSQSSQVPDKFYKRGSQEKNFSRDWKRRFFTDFPARMEEGFVLASYSRDLVFPSQRFHPTVVTTPIGV